MAQPERKDKGRILVIEDESDLREMLRYNLADAGYEVRTAETGDRGWQEFQTFHPDLILLDLMLSDVSGVEICRRIRGAVSVKQPTIVMVTAKGDEIDRVVGFEVGADDYVVKPFSVRELMLRVRARLQVGQGGSGVGKQLAGASGPDRARRFFEIGSLKIDVDSHRVFVAEEEIGVSPLEVRLLAYLAQSLGNVCLRQELLTNVWEYSPGVSSRTIDTHVKRLRDKLGSVGSLIQTVRGIGYRMSDPTAKSR